MTISDRPDPHRQAREALADLAANGGRLTLQPPEPDGLPRILIEYDNGADRERCRAIIAELKADPVAWNAATSLATTRQA